MSIVGDIVGLVAGSKEQKRGQAEIKAANAQMDTLESNAPKYSRPDEIKQYLEMAKTQANSDLPGRNQLEQNTQQATQSMLSKLQESGQLDAGSIQKLYQSEVGAYNNLNMQAAQYHQSQYDKLAQAFQQSAQYADQEFEYNTNAPWQRQYNRAINRYEGGQESRNLGYNTKVGSMVRTGDDAMKVGSAAAAAAGAPKAAAILGAL